uniref:Uncharacterized protein n=1 Tax=Cyprinus carpio TaxID=7962 RepID=A0A8C1N7H3_CYPCA
MTEVPLSKALNPRLLPGYHSVNGCPLLTVCVCSLLFVCTLDGLNAEHNFRVTILGCMSQQNYLHDRQDSDRGHERPDSDRGHDRRDNDRGHDRPDSDRGHDRPDSDRGHDRPDSDRGHDRLDNDRGHDRPDSDRGHDRPDNDRGHDRPHEEKAPIGLSGNGPDRTQGKAKKGWREKPRGRRMKCLSRHRGEGHERQATESHSKPQRLLGVI